MLLHGCPSVFTSGGDLQPHPGDEGATALSQPIQILTPPSTHLAVVPQCKPSQKIMRIYCLVGGSVSILFLGASNLRGTIFSSRSIRFIPGQCNLLQGSSYSPQFHSCFYHSRGAKRPAFCSKHFEEHGVSVHPGSASTRRQLYAPQDSRGRAFPGRSGKRHRKKPGPEEEM